MAKDTPIASLCRPTSMHPMLGISELLEQVFDNLTISEILLRAQIVSKLWKACIDGSTKLKLKCFLIAEHEKEEDELFTKFRQLGKIEEVCFHPYRDSLCRKFTEKTECTLITLATARKAFAEGMLDYPLYEDIRDSLCLASYDPQSSTSVLEQIYTVFPSYPKYIGVNPWRLHPLLQDLTFGSKACNDYELTGYGGHLFMIYKLGDFLVFPSIKQFIGSLWKILRRQPNTVWTKPISRPVCKQVTVVAGHCSELRDRTGWKTTQNEVGITVQDLFLLIAEAFENKLQEYSRVHWDAEYDGFHRRPPSSDENHSNELTEQELEAWREQDKIAMLKEIFDLTEQLKAVVRRTEI